MQNYICRLLESEKRITFDAQCSLLNRKDTLFIESKKDYKSIIARTASKSCYSDFYEKWEFIKLYKYSVPVFYDLDGIESLYDYLGELGIKKFDPENFKPDYILNTDLKDTEPLYWKNNDDIFIKFVLQKTYVIPEDFRQIDYRYPVVIYINSEKKILEIRYDSTKYNNQFDSMTYENIVSDCIDWLKTKAGFNLFVCEHTHMISIINDKQNENVKMYKQMMEMSSGAAAELTAAEDRDYVLPFIGEIRGLIEENEELFDQAEEVKQLLLQYLSDKEATASYPYIYIKWVKPVESQSYIVKVTFDYLNHRYTLLQHITGSCKDLEMGRMNDAIKYLCESGSFVKGEKI